MAAKNVLTLVQNLISSKLTRHITRRELVVREREVQGDLVVEKVPTEDNLADMFTKALDRIPFEKLRGLVMNLLARGVAFLAPRGKRSDAGHSHRAGPMGGCYAAPHAESGVP